MVKHENLHRYEWPLGKVLRVFPDPQGIIQTVEVEEGGKVSLRSVTFLVPLKLDCDDEEGNDSETETAQSNQAASASASASTLFSEASESPPAAEPSSSGRASPIKQELHVSSAEPSEGSFMQSAVMPLIGLHETPNHESADPTQRDSQSPSQRSSVGATSNVTMETRAVSSPQSPTPSRESAPSNAAPSSELITQRQPRRAAIRQRQLLPDLVDEDLI